MTDIRSRTKFFLDRPAVVRMIDAKTRKFLARSGGLVRSIARRRLKPAKAKTFDQLTARERRIYGARNEYDRARKRRGKKKPRLPKQVSAPGESPLTHMKPSPLRDGLSGITFALDINTLSVVVGPSPFRDNGAENLEHGGGGIAARPFMDPSLRIAEPKLAEFMRG